MSLRVEVLLHTRFDRIKNKKKGGGQKEGCTMGRTVKHGMSDHSCQNLIASIIKVKLLPKLSLVFKSLVCVFSVTRRRVILLKRKPVQ